MTKTALSASHTVLNIGCGFGRELVHLPPSTIGLDIDREIVYLAKKVSSKQVIRADAHYLPFRDNMFDGLAMAEVIEHLSSPMKALREASRVMRTGGKMVLQTPNRLVTMGIVISKDYGHVHEFTRSEIRKYVTTAGFSILSATGSTIPYVPSTSRLDLLNYGIGFRVWKWVNRHLNLLSWDIIIICEKA
jgi:ubiquinone/menaquinone biosynthesis C-methylase UbiE